MRPVNFDFVLVLWGFFQDRLLNVDILFMIVCCLFVFVFYFISMYIFQIFNCGLCVCVFVYLIKHILFSIVSTTEDDEMICSPLWVWSPPALPPDPPIGRSRVSGPLSGTLLGLAPRTVPDIPVQQPERRGSSPPLRDPEHVATTEPMCSTSDPSYPDRGAWQQEKDVMTSTPDCVLWDVRN